MGMGGGLWLAYAVETVFKECLSFTRRFRLGKYAKSRGYSFSEDDIGNRIAFSQIPFPQNPSESYMLGSAINIIEGAMAGLKFTYFEKTQVIVSGSKIGEESGVRSVVAIDQSANDRFESRFDKNLVSYRDNGTICFYWNDVKSDRAKPIPIDRLDHWLADIAATFER
jgi:hypothetical protein